VLTWFITARRPTIRLSGPRAPPRITETAGRDRAARLRDAVLAPLSPRDPPQLARRWASGASVACSLYSPVRSTVSRLCRVTSSSSIRTTDAGGSAKYSSLSVTS